MELYEGCTHYRLVSTKLSPDLQRVAFYYALVYGVRELMYCVAHTLKGRYVFFLCLRLYENKKNEFS
ncbi:hypothetical protein DSB67_05225 [Vibrio campbellii]|nr:hypothetical protein DSB67_05225 [Vibrio campbellii]